MSSLPLPRPGLTPGDRPPARPPPRLRSGLLAAGAGLAGALLWAACSLPGRDASNSGVSPCVEGCLGPDAALDSPAEASQVGLDGAADGSPRNANCGEMAGCNPDPNEASKSCGGSLVQRNRGASAPWEPEPKGLPGVEISVTPALLDGSTPDAEPPPPMIDRVLACQVVRKDKTSAATCVYSGEAREGEACRGFFSENGAVLITDCVPGLACVRGLEKTGETSTGQCRPYCCFGGASCGVGAWCSPRRIFETSSSLDPLFVPVCAPADNCKLFEKNVCPAGQACMVVADSTTSCDVPGNGTDGQACPCAEGFVCARSTNTCRALCRLGHASDCPGSFCVGGGSALPPGYGLCTGER